MIDIALIEQCKNPNVDTQIIQKIIQVESNNQQYAININKVGSFILKNKKEASTLAKNFIQKGYSVDIGLMQFNSNNLKSSMFSNYNIDDLLDICKNIKAGSDIFYLAYETTNENLTKEERINQALSIYNTGNLNDGFNNGYVAKYNDYSFNPLLEKAKKSQTRITLEYKPFNLQTQKKDIK
ncbi:TPA: lytic transglycosylase domain-containing protein [Campylobacter jejuni]|nr:lytic transglycosylase domain-containing protein [Campylobacter lari]MCV3433340.1 lytic transglycosylase domain-containing protein [Campylobacter lari]